MIDKTYISTETKSWYRRKCYLQNNEKALDRARSYRDSHKEQIAERNKRYLLSGLGDEWDEVVGRIRSSGADLSKIRIAPKRDEARQEAVTCGQHIDEYSSD